MPIVQLQELVTHENLIRSFIRSFNKYLLSSYCVQDPEPVLIKEMGKKTPKARLSFCLRATAESQACPLRTLIRGLWGVHPGCWKEECESNMPISHGWYGSVD